MTSAQLKEYRAKKSAPGIGSVPKKAKVKEPLPKDNQETLQRVSRALISIDRLLPGLNGSDGLIRQNHFKATKVKSGLLELVKAGRHGTFGRERVKIICTRYYCGTAMDFDNASASFKYLVDAIVKAGIIYDDSPKTIEEWTVRQVKVESRKLQKMEVEILLYDNDNQL